MAGNENGADMNPSFSSPGADKGAGPVPAYRGRPVVRSLLRIIEQFNAALLFILSLSLGVLACLGLAQVLWRYVLNEPLVWTEEVVRYALIWIVFLGAGAAIKRGMLAAVELVSQLVSDTLRKMLTWTSLAICCTFWAILLIYGVIILGAVQGMKSGALEMPMPLVYLAIPVGAAIALVNTLAVAVDPPEPTLDSVLD